MTDAPEVPEVHHGLEGVVAFASEIAEPDKEGSSLRYRGVDIEQLVGRVPFENVWGLLVDGAYTPGLPPAEPYNIAIHTGDVRADVAAAFSGAIGAMSGPLHGGAPSRVLGMIEEVEKSGDAASYVKGLLDNGERLMGFGHRVYRAEDPRSRVLKRIAKELGSPRVAVPSIRTCRSSGCQGNSRAHAGLARSSAPLRDSRLVKNVHPSGVTPLSSTIREDGAP